MTEKNVLYKKKIFKDFYFSHHLSSSDLVVRLHLSLPLVTKMLNVLLEQHIIVDTGYAPSTGGRRPVLYSLRPDVFYVVAIAMDQLFTRMVIMDKQHRHVVG